MSIDCGLFRTPPLFIEYARGEGTARLRLDYAFATKEKAVIGICQT